MTMNEYPVELKDATANRRRALRAHLQGRKVILYSGQAPARNFPANRYPFRASSHFLHFVGALSPRTEGIRGKKRCFRVPDVLLFRMNTSKLRYENKNFGQNGPFSKLGTIRFYWARFVLIGPLWSRLTLIGHL